MRRIQDWIEYRRALRRWRRARPYTGVNPFEPNWQQKVVNATRRLHEWEANRPSYSQFKKKENENG